MKHSGAIVGSVVIVAAFAAVSVAAASATPTPVSIEPDPTPAASVDPTPTPPPATLDAYGILHERGEDQVEVVYSTNPAINCGLGVGTIGGCFNPSQPETIVLSPGVEGAMLTYFVLHELAHLRQHRHGMPIDECEADAAAVAWGADETLTHYLPTCEGVAP